MDRLVPLSALEHPAYGVLAVDAQGGVRFCNRAAACLLRIDLQAARSLTCWRLAHLWAPDGVPFCSANCPVQREARHGVLPPSQSVVTRASRNGAGRKIELVTFLVPPSRGGRFPVLHLLRPIPPDERARAAAHAPGVPTAASPPLPAIGDHPLSPREEEVFRLLAAGLRDRQIADRLFISPVTVRNHVGRILQKLGVHRRLEAVIAFMRRSH